MRSATSSFISSSKGGATTSTLAPAARAPGPPAARVLSRQQPRDRNLRARIVDRTGRVERAQHEEDVRLVKERERELAPEIARLGVGRVRAARHPVGQQELDAAPERAL